MDNPNLEEQETSMTANSKWYDLRQEFRNYRKPRISAGRIVKDGLVSLIPGSLPMNCFRVMYGIQRVEKEAESVYDKRHQGIPTKKDSLQKAAGVFFTIWGAAGFSEILEIPILAHSLALYNGSENPVRDAACLTAAYLAKTVFNFGANYARDYIKSQRETIRKL
jgi:hypothetical protein